MFFQVIAMETISFRPSKKTISEFEHFLSEENMAKSDLARRLFEIGLVSYRKSKALEEFEKGKLSFLSAAKSAGVSAFEFLELAKASKITFVHLSEPDLQEELRLSRG